MIEIKVFVSCPSDVNAEKDLIKTICDSLNNDLMANGRKARFRVLDFRDIVAEWGGRAQEQINVIFSDYDIYIGLLWMRFGTPTGATDPVTGKEYLSGTEEEFRLALQRKKTGENINIYLLFKEAIAPKDLAATKQLLQVQEFFDEVRNEGWVNTFPNNHEIKFTTKIFSILFNRAEKAEKQTLIKIKKEFLEKLAIRKTNTVSQSFANLISKAPSSAISIPRTIISFDGQKDFLTSYLERTADLQLTQVITEKRLVVLLGNAGSGKSIELAKLAHHYASEHTPYVPVYARMNTYVEQDINDFLPKGWSDVPQENVLVILDGLDEVQPQHFNTAIRKIRSFCDDFPEVHVVLSCRTNFYHLPDKNSKGSLPEFNIYFLAEITSNQAKEYAEAQYGIDYGIFLKEIRKHSFEGFIAQPFFLQILLGQFKDYGKLPSDRIALLNLFLEERILFDEKHFEFTTNLRDHKELILKLLQKIALVMEYLGRNYVSYDELLKILPSAHDIQLIKFSTAFKNMENGTNNWGFEHNNIQEFLAAKALLAFDMDTIKSFLSLDNKRIKPSWLNTLFFLCSLLPNSQCDELISWILQIEPEVLVRVEPDKIDEEKRFTIFRTVFLHYKDLGIWLQSNKFSDRELAKFGQSDKSLQFLLSELGNEGNSRITRLNALKMLQYFKLVGDNLQSAKVAIMQFVISNASDQYIVNDGIHALQKLGITDAKTIGELMVYFGDRGAEHIRSAIYSILIEANLTDNYIDYLITGFLGEYDRNDRGKINFMNEDIFLTNALFHVNDVNSIKKLLSIFENSFDRRIIDFYERGKLLAELIKKSIKLNAQFPDLSDSVYKVYKNYGRHSEEHAAAIIAEFFIKTDQGQIAFKKILTDSEIHDYEKGLLLAPFINKENIDYLIGRYKDHNATNEDLLKFYNNVRWYANTPEKSKQLKYLTEQLQKETSVLQDFEEVDYAKIRAENEQKSFDLYFNVQDFANEVTKFFVRNEIDELDWDTLWHFEYNRNQKNYEIPEAVQQLLADYTRGKHTIKLDTVLAFVNNAGKFTNYRFSKIKDKLTHHSNIVASERQVTEITEWVQTQIIRTDIKNAIMIKNRTQSSYSELAMVLWYFIKRYSIEVDGDKLLDFTLFDELRNNQDQGLDFETIEKKVGSLAVQKRVRKNLKDGIQSDSVWRNNALYALDKSVPDTVNQIIKDIFNEEKSDYIRRTVMSNYIDRGYDAGLLFNCLSVMNNSDLTWDIVRKVKHMPEIDFALRNFLTEKLTDSDVSRDEKIEASKVLTEKGDKMGTAYYLDYIANDASPDFDFHRNGVYVQQIRDIEFLPTLLKLLDTAYQPEYQADNFNRLDSIVTDALFNMGLLSEGNLAAVKEGLLAFIKEREEKVKHVNFLHPMIERMEFNFYLAQSQKGNILDALNEVEKLFN